MKNLKTKHVSMKEFKEFILSQPDDRIIDFDYFSPEEIGCPLVHYSRNKFKRKVKTVGLLTASTDRETIIFDSDVQIFMFKLINQKETSYKKVKKIISKFN